MKQNITAEQLNELREKDKKKLMGEIDTIYCSNVQKKFPAAIITHWHEDSNYLLSIGQMIGFLDEKVSPIEIDKVDNAWYVGSSMYKKVTDEISDTCLCDSLWEAVKAVIML